MRSLFMLRRSPWSFVTLTVILFIAVSSAQQGGGRGEGPDTLADTPQILGSRGQRFRVTPIKGLFRPSALAFLPNGDILVAERSGGLQFSLCQKLRMIALHKSQQPVATTSSFFHPPFARARCLLFMTDIFGCDRAWLRQNTRFLITAVAVAKSYVAPLSEDIDLK